MDIRKAFYFHHFPVVLIPMQQHISVSNVFFVEDSPIVRFVLA